MCDTSLGNLSSQKERGDYESPQAGFHAQAGTQQSPVREDGDGHSLHPYRHPVSPCVLPSMPGTQLWCLETGPPEKEHAQDSCVVSMRIKAGKG